MGQKANLLTLKSSFINLNLQTLNSKFFLYGYFFILSLTKLCLKKNIVLSKFILNFVGNILFLNLKLYFKTIKIFCFKNFKYETRKTQKKIHKIFFTKLFKSLKFLKINLFIFSIQILNKELKQKKNKILLKILFFKSKLFLNILFQRRFTFFFDFLKQIVLLIQNLIQATNFLQILSQLFKYLHKRMHTRFFVFFNLICNLITTINSYTTNKLQIKGLKLLIKGKLQGKMRASFKYLQDGKIPMQTFNKKIDFAKQNLCTLYGVYGLALWIYWD